MEKSVGFSRISIEKKIAEGILTAGGRDYEGFDQQRLQF